MIIRLYQKIIKVLAVIVCLLSVFSVSAQSDAKKEVVNYLKSINSLEVPFYDSTNFNNLGNIGTMNSNVFDVLKFKDVFGELANVSNSWVVGKLDISNQFTSLLIGSRSEHEMNVYIVNYDDNYSIISKTDLSYDEIAESCFCKEALIAKTKIVVYSFDYCFESGKDTYELSISEKGKIHPLK